jgi:hypothetical protein
VHLVNKTGASALGSPAPVRTRKLSLLSQDHLWSIPDEVYREKLDSDPQLIVDDLNQIRESNYTLDEVMPEVQAALRHRHAPTSSNASDDLGDPSQEQLWLPSPSSVESFNCRHIPGGIVDVYKSIGCSESMDELTSEYEPGSERSRSEEANARMRARVNFFAGPEGPTRKNAPSVSPSADRILASRGFKWTRALDEPSDQFHRAIADGGGSGY